MQKGNDCDTVQVFEKTGMIREEIENKKYLDNTALIKIAQGDNEKEAMEATEKLLMLNRGLVRTIVLRFRDRGVDIEDLMQIGTIGLLKAVRSFDLDRGTCFSTYAVPMIFGEIRRTLRDEGPIKVGRYYKKLGIDLMRARNEIINAEGKEPHISRLALELGVPIEEAAMALDAMAPPVSLSDFVYGEEDGTVLEDMLADTDSIDENERFFDRMALRQAISKMPLQWQRIVLLRYFRNKTQQQVADTLGLSQVKVSREEKKIVAFLQSEMK
ncbi:MAG: sigma-70 family RNA polymerase sigma factor [Ruminococcaceae bacterium]|nr:sigma-70 family RNA polymerase sigma factor [Oscillospiraceae bacterium]